MLPIASWYKTTLNEVEGGQIALFLFSFASAHCCTAFDSFWIEVVANFNPNFAMLAVYSSHHNASFPQITTGSRVYDSQHL